MLVAPPALLSPGCSGAAARLAAQRHDHAVHLSVPRSGCPRDLSCGPASGYREGEELCAHSWGAGLARPHGGQGVSHAHRCSCPALSLQATDVDSGLGGTITFSIFKVEVSGNNRTLENLFKVVTTVEQNNYIGSIQ